MATRTLFSFSFSFASSNCCVIRAWLRIAFSYASRCSLISGALASSSTRMLLR
jgi:hypothetical protein